MECFKCKKSHDGSFGSGKYCSKSCANSRTFSEESKLKKSNSNKGNIPWNKNKRNTWLSIECEVCSLPVHYMKCRPKKYHSECWLKNSGGYRKGSGIGKKGWYKGYWCDSTYELVWIIFQLDHEIPFERNKTKFEYTYENKLRHYTPDFIQDGKFIEIKGYLNKEIETKHKSVPDLIVLFKNDLKKEFEYVISKYGKNFVDLYDNI